jgi:hypothetical protein
MTFIERWQWAITNPSDIGSHIQWMTDLGAQYQHITEFGVRSGVSTTAWLSAQPHYLVCYDINVPGDLREIQNLAIQRGIVFQFNHADTTTVEIEPTSLLFIDTLHNAATLSAELNNNEAKVSDVILIHDTVSCGWTGEAGGQGILVALMDFLLSHPWWKIEKHFTHCNGLTMLRRIGV